jgi:hypothetical protein
MIDFSILLEAYFDCRRHKRKTVGATEFEMNYMSNLVQLLDEINSRQYKIGKSICFVVRYPATAKCSLVSFVTALSTTISH